MKSTARKEYNPNKTYTITTDTGRVYTHCTYKDGAFHTPDGGIVRNDHEFTVKEEK